MLIWKVPTIFKLIYPEQLGIWQEINNNISGKACFNHLVTSSKTPESKKEWQKTCCNISLMIIIIIVITNISKVPYYLSYRHVYTVQDACFYSSDLSHSETRLSVYLDSFEWHIYNRSSVYSELETLFGLEPTLKKQQQEQQTEPKT